MAQSFSQIQKQIQKLQKQADKLRQSEVGGVIERIKTAISHYGLTASQLGLGTGTAASKSVPSAKTVKGSRISGPAFSDGQGSEWSGRGPRPAWLKEALAKGRTIDEFRISAKPSAAGMEKSQVPAPLPVASKKVRAKRAASKTNYSDGAGKSWSGRGPRPSWLKEALSAGKELKDFLQPA